MSYKVTADMGQFGKLNGSFNTLYFALRASKVAVKRGFTVTIFKDQPTHTSAKAKGKSELLKMEGE